MTNANDKITPVTMEWEEIDKGVNRVKEFTGGLTKREFFAAMALQGLCANEKAYDATTDEQLASAAVCNADALINQLNKE